MAGGLLGHQIGGGTGRTLATVGGAAAGGYAGNQVQENDTVSSTKTRCKTVYETHTKTVGYDVRYRLGKEEDNIRMSHQPGPRIPVKDGQLQLHAPAAP